MNLVKNEKWGSFIGYCIIVLFLSVILQSTVFAQTGSGSAILSPTPAASEGPFWKEGSPPRNILYQEKDPGERVQVSGKVLDRYGKPIPGAKIDIWQTDAQGVYDNSGFDYRGYVVSDVKGQYSFKTVKPGEYPSRTPHIHIKISTSDGRYLTTQLYFPDFSERNETDYLYKKQLSVKWSSNAEAAFDFVLSSR